ncbi:hypothetical protein M569_03164, partial [Genlisea aurea]
RIPSGILLIRRIRGRDWSESTFRNVVLSVTFIAYTAYHASRKPSSIIKSALNRSGLGQGWPPFAGPDGTSKLGEIDLAFLACYSLGMYIAGHLGDRCDLRIFLTFGMIGSGIFVGLFGMGYFWNIHSFGYFLIMQMIAGLFQATGWPSVVAVIGNWFGKDKRGLIMGIWNAHTSIGNITGSLMAASVLEFGWGWSFLLPAGFIIAIGILVWLLLPAYPEDFSLTSPTKVSVPAMEEEEEGLEEGLIQNSGDRIGKGIGLLQASSIPGVIPFAISLFFAKLVAYTFLYWLPFYLTQTAIEGKYMSIKSAGNLSTLFDIGGITGGVIAGYISDKLNARAATTAAFLYLSIPLMILYRMFGTTSRAINIVLMAITGLVVNGPYALITTAVSADLGTHSSLRGNSRALATVTAIIDGTGSLGAALGPLLTGFLSSKGWDMVFVMLVMCAFLAALVLSHLAKNEV